YRSRIVEANIRLIIVLNDNRRRSRGVRRQNEKSNGEERSDELRQEELLNHSFIAAFLFEPDPVVVSVLFRKARAASGLSTQAVETLPSSFCLASMTF